MKLFAGLSRTDYEDVFRAVGALIDDRGWSNVSLTEVDDGLLVQAMVKLDQREIRPRLETYLLTDTDLERVLRDAVLRRHKKEEGRQRPAPLFTAAPPPAPSKVATGPLATKEPPPSAPTWPPPAAPQTPERGEHSRSTAADFSEVASQVARITQARSQPTGPLPFLLERAREQPASTAVPEDLTPFDPAPFDPAPMRLSTQPPESKIDTGAARAAVVMAHIVAARIKSGVPITSDDPDLASLLEQVRALDESNIGEKG